MRSVAVNVFQHLLLFPVKFLHVSLVPIYAEHGKVAEMHPLPYVTHPVKNLEQSASVVAS